MPDLAYAFERPSVRQNLWMAGHRWTTDGRVCVFDLSTHADSDNSNCFGGKQRWGSYLRRKDRANSFANREELSVLIITHVSKHNEASESGFTTTP